jgi:hypothetical protein
MPSCADNSGTRLLWDSAYIGEPSDGKFSAQILNHLRLLHAKLPMLEGGWRLVEVYTFASEREVEAGRMLMNDVINEGKAWPSNQFFETEESFQGYFLSHAAFVVRWVRGGDDGNGNASVLGCVSHQVSGALHSHLQWWLHRGTQPERQWSWDVNGCMLSALFQRPGIQSSLLQFGLRKQSGITTLG